MTDGTLPGPSLESQMIYRLASLEATMSNSFKRIDEKIENFQKDFHHRDMNRVAQIAALETKLETIKETQRTSLEATKVEIDQRVKKLELFRTELLSKALGISLAVGAIWVTFGDLIKRALGI